MNDNKTTAQDLEPPKYVVPKFQQDDFVVNDNDNLNEFQLNYKGIMNKKHPHDKIVTFQDLNKNKTSDTIVFLEGNFKELYIVGLKPIIMDSSTSYVEPEQSNHFDFIFMVLCPFLALMLVLRLRKKYKKKK